jgi:hypothetical protein
MKRIAGMVAVADPMTGPHLYLLGGFDFAGVGAAVPAFSRKARAMVFTRAAVRAFAVA